MKGKIFLYILNTILILWSIDSVNINQIIKKNRITQAKVFYFFICMILIYLLTNFEMDIFETFKIIG